MSYNEYASEDIVDRIYLTLPTKFTREQTSQLYALLYGISSALKLNSDFIDELYRQTNIDSATGAYVDDYIQGLLGLGRGINLLDNSNQTDDSYKSKFKNIAYKYNATKSGLESIVIDFMGKSPYQMYNSQKRGAHLNGRYYYNDSAFRSIYGNDSPSGFIGYIEFTRKPNYIIFDDICKVVTMCKAMGITIYLKYPLGNDLVVSLSDGTLERATIT